eukprot:443794-Amphidinium_carterae.1
MRAAWELVHANEHVLGEMVGCSAPWCSNNVELESNVVDQCEDNKVGQFNVVNGDEAPRQQSGTEQRRQSPSGQQSRAEQRSRLVSGQQSRAEQRSRLVSGQQSRAEQRSRSDVAQLVTGVAQGQEWVGKQAMRSGMTQSKMHSGMTHRVEQAMHSGMTQSEQAMNSGMTQSEQ